MTALPDSGLQHAASAADASRPTDHDHGSGGGRPCRCGHALEAHEHYRPGTDCALCAPGDCTKYRPARG